MTLGMESLYPSVGSGGVGGLSAQSLSEPFPFLSQPPQPSSSHAHTGMQLITYNSLCVCVCYNSLCVCVYVCVFALHHSRPLLMPTLAQQVSS